MFFELLSSSLKYFKEKISDMYQLGVMENIFESEDDEQGYCDGNINSLFMSDDQQRRENTLQSLYFAFTDHPDLGKDSIKQDPFGDLIDMEERPSYNVLMGIFFNFVVFDPIIRKVLEHLIPPVTH
jgi:hypothetical protein